MLGSRLNITHLRVSGGSGTFIRLVLENTKKLLVMLEVDQCDAKSQDLSDVMGITIRDLRISRCHANVRFLLGPVTVLNLEEVTNSLVDLDDAHLGQLRRLCLVDTCGDAGCRDLLHMQPFSSLEELVIDIPLSNDIHRKLLQLLPAFPVLTNCRVVSRTEMRTRLDGAPFANAVANAPRIPALRHVLQGQNDDTHSWYETFVDAHSGEILLVTDFVAESTHQFTMVSISKDVVTEGEETPVNPEDIASSASGWLSSNQTAGDNVLAYKSSHSATTFESSNDIFDYPYDTTLGPTSWSNIDAAWSSAFYIINKYGWTETSYNFQNSNVGKGGAEGDRVLMGLQDRGGAITQTLLHHPSMSVLNGALQNDIVVREFTLVRCYGRTEPKDSTVPDYVLATWVFDNPAGIRNYPYSTNASVNPLLYSSIQQLNEVHNIGEWTNMLHNVYAALVCVHGFSSTVMDDSSKMEGNVVWLHLFIDARSLQPCNPTYAENNHSTSKSESSTKGDIFDFRDQGK
ncbi:Fungalysin metallopeptidase-domain-containing protein [Armillaria novae-zelandiae]|uniref:Extracellular metalloproteinase n=1 Tax=Armillaria novae-zelandiae TaxID=153914 RepID=A0AA39NKX7_9AGAR|nr:Fungalysin metallopeptidase-domain-containing protein [Armillaria novae-zelandiae]